MASQPNILVMLADDQGWGDLGYHGNVNLKTPHLDSLAKEGASFSYFYVCPVCAPTRAEFLTGKYHQRVGVQGVSEGRERLNASALTLADELKEAGYATGLFGKWHNGTQPPYHPNNRGFDTFYGFTSGHWSHYFDTPMDKNGERVTGEGFMVDDYTVRALEFMEEHRDEPFFCFVPFNTPHSPMMVPDRFYDPVAKRPLTRRYRDRSLEDMAMTRSALALCENIDWNVGRLLRQLDALSLRGNTIVIYFSDNGPNSYRWNGGMKGRKASVDEGGLRSPLLVRWPTRIGPYTQIDTVASVLDLYPTLLDCAGILSEGRASLDGRSLLGLLTAKGEAWPERPLFSTWAKKASVRMGNFRYDRKGMLYDLANDPSQYEDVAEKFPEQTARLRKLLEDHVAAMAEERAKHQDRPFTVGYGPNTQLPARDGVPHGGINRSSKAPNNSFFEDWTSDEQYITWDVDIGETARYQAMLYYTAEKEHVGVQLQLSATTGGSVSVVVSEAFDPPRYDKSKERVEESHYTMKPFKPLPMGAIDLKKGRAVLTLSASELKGAGVVDVYALDLKRAE